MLGLEESAADDLESTLFVSSGQNGLNGPGGAETLSRHRDVAHALWTVKGLSTVFFSPNPTASPDGPQK